MSDLQVLVVAGTHGNEINAPWLLDHWQKNQDLIKTKGFHFSTAIGNPRALEQGKRYLDRDLNRSFLNHFLDMFDLDYMVYLGYTVVYLHHLV